jgi:hypothetical protein
MRYKRIIHLASGLALIVMAGDVLGLGCAASPRTVPCSNHADCTAVDSSYGYCLERRCVQCISDAGCSFPGKCVDGTCEKPCNDGRECDDNQSCHDGKCVNR